MFRSGRLDTLPPGAPGNADGLVDVALLEQRRFTMAELSATISTPIALPDGTIVSGVNVLPAPPFQHSDARGVLPLTGIVCFQIESGLRSQTLPCRRSARSRHNVAPAREDRTGAREGAYRPRW
jgi:hypothetical protein